MASHFYSHDFLLLLSKMSKMKGDGISVESDGESHRANGSTPSINQSGTIDVDDEMVFEGTTSSSSMLYRVADHPPIHLTIFFGFQVSLMQTRDKNVCRSFILVHSLVQCDISL